MLQGSRVGGAMLGLVALCASGVLNGCGASDGLGTAESGDDAESGGAAGAAGNDASGGSAGTGGAGGAGGAAGTETTPSCGTLPGTPGSHEETLESSGRARTVRVHVPASYGGDATMLVITFHGWLEDSKRIEEITTLSDTSDAHGFIVAYPQGLSDSWNAGGCCGTPPGEGNDDVQFARDLVAHLQTKYCIDPSRIYATGFSNGAMMSHRIGCEAADLFAAIAPVSGQIAVSSCTPSRPVPVWEVQGTADLILPFNGLGTLDQTIAGWVQRNGCTGGQPVQILKNGSATCHAYTACQADADIHVCEIEGGGHQWPGGVSTGAIGGTLSNDIDASESIYRFFVAHPMPGG